MREFEVPSNYEEAEERLLELSDDIEEIQSQLADKNRTDDDGNRMSTDEYKDWRRKAGYALSCKINEYRFIKDWTTKIDGSVVGESDLEDEDRLLSDAYKALRNLGFLMNWDIDSETQEVIDNIQFHLLKRSIIS